MFHQQGDVFAPFAQGRHGNGVNVQAVEKVGTKPACCNFSVEVFVSGSNKPHIGFQGTVAADPLKIAILQDTQEFCLRVLGQLTDLIKK